MKKVCIFCGENPVNKNKEHIIPKWLIEMTGDPKRVANIFRNGNDYVRFSWQSYAFPACEECNDYYSDLEAKTKKVIENLLNEKSVCHNDFNILLDWLDKVRIGIWLGNLMLKKVDLDPNYYINQRIGKKDRVCILYKINDNEKGIGIIGTHTLAFEGCPSCFSLVINNLVLINYSKEVMLLKNMGFPYPNEYYYDNDYTIFDKINNGTCEIKYPIIDSLLYKPATRFYQSIIETKGNYKRPHVGKISIFLRKNCFIYTNNIIKSRILIIDENSDIDGFWGKKSIFQFKFPEKFVRELMFLMVGEMVLEQQNKFINNDRDLYKYSNEDEKLEREQYFAFLISQNNKELTEIRRFYSLLLKK